MVQLDFQAPDNIEYDFEAYVRKEMLPEIEKAPPSNTFGLMSTFGSNVDPKRRTVMCSHWVKGLCQKGSRCDFLHKLDKSRAPLCKYGKKCKTKDCPLKHEEDDKECLNYKQGFCFKGRSCLLRHVKQPPDECPPLYDFTQVIEGNVPMSKKRKTHQPNASFRYSLCLHWLEHGECHFGEECHFAHGEGELQSAPGPNMELVMMKDGKEYEVFDSTRDKMDNALNLPFKNGAKLAYFLCHAPDLQHSLRLARERSYWGVSERVALDINAAFRSKVDHVIIFFYVKSHRALYGVAMVPGPIDMRPSPYSPLIFEFPVRWIHTMRTSIRMVSQIKMYDDSVLGKCERTAQDIKVSSKEKHGGFEMLLVCLRKPEWNWHTDMRRANLAHNSDYTSLMPISSPYGDALGPDALFSLDWISHVSSGGNGLMGLMPSYNMASGPAGHHLGFGGKGGASHAYGGQGQALGLAGAGGKGGGKGYGGRGGGGMPPNTHPPCGLPFSGQMPLQQQHHQFQHPASSHHMHQYPPHQHSQQHIGFQQQSHHNGPPPFHNQNGGDLQSQFHMQMPPPRPPPPR